MTTQSKLSIVRGPRASVVHGPEARELAKDIFNEQLAKFQEVGVDIKGLDIFKIATRKSGE